MFLSISEFCSVAPLNSTSFFCSNINKEITSEGKTYNRADLIKGLSHIVENDSLTGELYLKKQCARLERIREGTEGREDIFERFEE